jgi:putative tricarboxylic transport membrane protein
VTTVPLFASILRIPFSIIDPIIVVVCFIGAYTVASHTFDLWLLLVFGLVGYAFKKLDYPIAPLVLAMVIGDKAEDAFRQSMILSKGSVAIFWSNGIAGTLTMLGLLLVFWPLLAGLFGLVRTRRPSPHDILEVKQ